MKNHHDIVSLSLHINRGIIYSVCSLLSLAPLLSSFAPLSNAYSHYNIGHANQKSTELQPASKPQSVNQLKELITSF